MKTKTLLPLLVSFALAFAFSGCGKKGNDAFKMIKNVQVKTYQQNGNNYAEIQLVLDTAGVRLPGVDVPIFNPNKTEQVFGHFLMRGRTDGLTDVIISVNLDETTTLPSQEAVLPNGRPIPLGGVEKMIVFPTGKSHILIYLALANNSAVVGTAIPIKEFDKIGKKIGGLNFFPMFQIEDILATAGVFTGTEEGQSGVAVFVDASKALSKVLPPPFLPKNGLRISYPGWDHALSKEEPLDPWSDMDQVDQEMETMIGPKYDKPIHESSSIQLYEVKPSSSKIENLKQELYQALSKTQSLHIH